MTEKTNILIVEGEANIARDLQKMLQSLGYHITGVEATGSGGIEQAVKLKPNLILMDILLSGDMDGIEAANQIQKRLDLPVVFILASTDKKILARTRKARPSGYIFKPFGLAELEAIIEMALSKHEMERRLKASEERFRSLYENSTIGMYRTTPSGQIVMANPGLVKILGYSSFAELADRNLEDEGFTMGFPRSKFKELIEETGEIRGLEFAWKKQDGRIIYVRESAKAFRDSHGNTVYYDGTIEDITDRKLAEKALEESEIKFKHLYEKTPLGYQSLDGNGHIVEVNPAWLDMLCYSREEVVGKWFGDFLTSQYKERFKRNFSKFKAAGQIDGVQFKMIHKDGHTFDAEFTGKISYDKEGNFQQTHCIVYDITDRKRAEEEVKKSQEELANLTAHLQSVREEERAKIVREIHDELGQSLTALKMDLSWLSNKFPNDQEPFRKKTESMMALTDSMVHSVRRISRDLRPRLLDELGLAAAIDWQSEEFQKHTGINCELTIEPEDISLNEDLSTAIFRIAQEGLTNVARHACASTVSVYLKQRQNNIELVIRDNGRGITEKEIHNPTSFGLMGIRERAQFLGGNIKFQGIRNKGTTISLNIPLRKS